MQNHPLTRAGGKLPSAHYLIVAALAALLAACGGPPGGSAGGAPGAAAGSASRAGTRPTEVGVITVRVQRLTVTSELPGRTSAYLTAEVRPQVSGIIKARLFTEGANVRAGDPLYQIDPTTYQAAYDNAAAVLAKAEANAAAARSKGERYAELAKKQLISKQDDEDVQAALKQADADVQSARAGLETARANLAYTRIAAPISGRTSTSTVTPGALVTANQDTALATVHQLDPIYVDVTQPAAEVLRLRRDLTSGRIKGVGGKAAVKLQLEDGSEYAQEGVLAVTGTTVSEKTGAITLRAVVPNPQAELLPGMFVRAVLEEGVNDRAILVPQQSVQRDTRGMAIVLVVNGDNQVEQRSITTGAAVRDQWVVESGLEGGERVIVQGLQKIKAGDLVRATTVDLTTGLADAALPVNTASAH
jgi:membrane fusion protein (multidrug efflux system)